MQAIECSQIGACAPLLDCGGLAILAEQAFTLCFRPPADVNVSCLERSAGERDSNPIWRAGRVWRAWGGGRRRCQRRGRDEDSREGEWEGNHEGVLVEGVCWWILQEVRVRIKAVWIKSYCGAKARSARRRREMYEEEGQAGNEHEYQGGRTSWRANHRRRLPTGFTFHSIRPPSAAEPICLMLFLLIGCLVEAALVESSSGSIVSDDAAANPLPCAILAPFTQHNTPSQARSPPRLSHCQRPPTELF